MTELEFAPVFAILVDYFGAKPSEAVSNIYYEAFKSWPLEDFKAACQSVMESRIFNGLPKIAELRESMTGSIEDAKTAAYQSLLSATASGSYKSVVFEDGAIGRAVEAMGGWQRVCDMTWDDWKFRRKEFEAHYVTYLRRGETEPVKLLGLFEAHNNENEEWKRFTPEPINVKSKNALLIKSIKRGENYLLEEKGGEVNAEGGGDVSL